MKLYSKMKRPGAMLAGIFSLALTSVVLLCGAGSVPIENFSPQGAMQADLNAGGHNLTNIATVSATNVVVSGSLSAANIGSAATNSASAFVNTAWLGAGVGGAITNAVNGASGPVVADANNNIPYDPHGMGISNQSFLFVGDSITSGVGISYLYQSFTYLFSQGQYAVNHAVRHTTTGTLTAGTGSFTVGSASGIAIGQFVSATGAGMLSAGTLVSGVSGSTITVSPAPTGSGAATLTFTNVFNLGSSGAQIPSGAAGTNNITDMYSTLIKPHRPTANGGDGGLKSTIYLLIGTNDIGAASKTATQVIGYLTTWIATAQGDGFTVICSTILPRSDSGWTTTMEGYRETVNQAIRNNSVTSNNPVLDWASMIDITNSLYSSDNIHPNVLGNSLMAYYLTNYSLAGGSLVPAGSYGVFDEPVYANQGLQAPTLTVYNTNTSQGSQLNIVSSGNTFEGAVGYGNSGYLTDLQGKNFLFSGGPDWIFANSSSVLADFVMTGGNAGNASITGAWTAGGYTATNPSSSGGSQLNVTDNSGNLKGVFGFGNSGYLSDLQSRIFIYDPGNDFVLADGSNAYFRHVHGTARFLFGTNLGDDGSSVIQVSGGNARIESAGNGFQNYYKTLAATGTATPGLVTLTGTTATQTLTLPSPASAGLECVIKNQSSQAWTISSASGSQIIPSGTASTGTSTISLSSGGLARLWSDGTYWNQQ